MIAAGKPQPSYDVDLLLVLPVSVARNSNGKPDELLFESQACNGMEQWLENFSRIEVICPLLPENEIHERRSSTWKPVSEIANSERVKFIPLPRAMSLGAFSRAYFQGRAVIRQAIQRARYLCFAIGGLFGDWGSVACLEARRLGRPYAVWTDNVGHKLGSNSASPMNPLQQLKSHVRSRLMRSLERRCIENSSLGLFHGASCYQEYSTWCRTSFVVHDVHAKASDAIDAAQLATKCEQIVAGGPLRIVYAGRADTIKGPFDWLEIIELLKERSVPIEASWIGDGPLLEQMRNYVAEHKLSDVVRLPGFVADRGELFSRLRDAHVFLFCHKELESPRNLVEALISGCPIIGYHSDFAAELTQDGGGEFVAAGDRKGLADRLCRLAADRSALVALTRAAAESGKRFNDVAVFQHRSELIKAHL